jgi:hypothetical protein
MLFIEIIAVYCRDHRKGTNTLCRYNVNFLSIDAGGTYSYQEVLKDSIITQYLTKA